MLINFIQKIKEKVVLQLLVIYTRYLIGGAFVFASLIKIKRERFTTEPGIDNPIDSAWHLFETLYQSGLYWQFLGIGQLVAGFLLMTQKYSKLGALIFLPIISNVFVITISYYFAGTPIITGSMLLATIALILWDWNENRSLLNYPIISDSQKNLEKDRIWAISGLVLFLFTFTYRILIDRYDIFLWGGICFLIGTITLILGLKKRKYYPKPLS